MSNLVKVENLEVIEAELETTTLTTTETNTLKEYYFPGQPKVDSTTQLVQLWLHSKEIKSDQTRRVYRQVIEELSQWMYDRYCIQDLRFCNLAHLQSFVKYLKEEKEVRGKKDKRGLSPNAIAKYTSAIRSLWSFGTKESIGYFVSNPASELDISWQDTLAERILSEKQIWKLEESAKELGDRHWMLFQLLYFSGCRVGEIGKTETTDGLRWKQFREDGNNLILTVTGKGNKTRSIRLDAATSKEILAVRGSASNDDPVFPNFSRRDYGKPLTDRTIRLMMDEIGNKAGIEFSPHWLRHSHASHAIKQGAPITQVQKQLGHSSSAITDRYVHINPEHGTGDYLRGHS